MISILGKMKRFDTAWSLVDDMRKQSLVTPQTLLILIRKYCAVHEVANAISVFHAFKKYGFYLGIDEFHGLLSALCRYKNVADAEHLLLCNEKTFPFETKSFNIVLNGWCNVLVYVREAKRFWREMGNRGVDKDVVSYGSMISCYSKASNINAVLKLFNHMKELGIVPDMKVYNAMVYTLAKGKCIEQAKNLLKTMEEKGVTPNAVTYNSLIKPLCKARRLVDARVMFDEMLNKGLSPSTRTYHAFFDVFTTVEEVFDLLNRMKQAGCKPVSETYIMLIRKLSRWRQFGSVFTLWDEMRESGVSPDRSAYIVLIHGLFLNGRLEDAFKYYEEMKAKGFAPEPKTDKMFQAWLSGKETRQSLMEDLEAEQAFLNHMEKKPGGASKISSPRRNSQRKPDMRSVGRERGFSL
nr:pentatricopeptide repeat protein AaPPR1126 [Agave angustifolia]